jgi:hypothetical protein
MPELSFEARALCLLALMLLVAGVERWFKGPAAERPREYAFMVLCALVGGLFGALFDQLSIAIAPEYFEIGKGIPRLDDFRWRVTVLGFRAGVFAGLVSGGALLIARGSGPFGPELGYRPLLASLAWPLGLALVLSVPGAATGPLDFPGYGADLEELGLTPDRRSAFLRVWGLHAGLYLGALLGLAVAVARLRRGLRTRSHAASSATG